MFISHFTFHHPSPAAALVDKILRKAQERFGDVVIKATPKEVEEQKSKEPRWLRETGINIMREIIMDETRTEEDGSGNGTGGGGGKDFQVCK